MKEHFNSIKPLDHHRDVASFQLNFQKKSQAAPGESREAAPNAEDVFDTRSGKAWLLDESAIDGMSFADAMDDVEFITNMARKPEGRSQMSMAHKPIDAGEVMRLFDL